VLSFVVPAHNEEAPGAQTVSTVRRGAASGGEWLVFLDADTVIDGTIVTAAPRRNARP
jgi:hypothetical protein